MKIIIIQNGDPWQTLASSSLIRGFKIRYADCNITWITNTKSYDLLRYNERISELCVGLSPLKGKFDLAINLTPSLDSSQFIMRLDAVERRGFIASGTKIIGSDQGNESILSVFLGESSTDKNVLQLLFRLSGIKWEGDGYDISYFPRNKMKKGKTGIAVTNSSLRTYVKDNLELDYSDLWHVPIRNNLFKRIDEINRVKHLITDDLFCLHAGISLRKHVEFLDLSNLNMSIEFFNKGHHYRINHGLH